LANIMVKRIKAAPETIIALGGDLRIGRAGEVFQALSAATDAGSVVVIDAAEVGKIDAAGLQTIVAATMRFRAANIQWRWRNQSPTLIDAAKMLGLEEALELR
jgi:anti-anti-sigma regulatory factor